MLVSKTALPEESSLENLSMHLTTPVTHSPGDPKPSSSLCGHPYPHGKHSHRYTNTHVKISHCFFKTGFSVLTAVAVLKLTL